MENVTWPLFGNERQNETTTFLKINRTCEIIEEPFHSRAKFWRSFNLLPYKTLHGTSVNDICDDGEYSCGTGNTSPDANDDVSVNEL